jgi:sugar lactone lactonase YvrE
MKKLIPLFIVITIIAKQSQAQIITTFAGNGTTGGGPCNICFGGDGGPATAAKLYDPAGLAFDATGNLYITDYANERIRMVNTLGVISTVAGNGYGVSTGTGGFSGDGGAATNAELHAPRGVAIDRVGNLYIVDGSNYRIRMVNTLGIITTIAGGGTSGLGDGGQATSAKLFNPSSITIDAAGNLYIGDQTRIRKVNTLGIITTVAGNGTSGFSGDGGQATNAEINSSFGITCDAAGNLYTVDSYTRIRNINTAGIISTIAGIGGGGYSGDGGQATNAELNSPYSVAFDAAGNLYIADAGNNRIRMINTAGIITTVAGNGTQSYSGDGGAATAAELNIPDGLVCDAAGNLFIADDGNNRIRKVCFNNCNVAGIQQFAINNIQVNIYPNPSNGSFVIEPNSTIKHTMQVYDVNSKLVLSQTINGKTTIDVSGLNKGIYNISLQSNEAIVNQRLVIVN